jgi:hypothetical protein
MKIYACIFLTVVLLAITPGCQTSRYTHRQVYLQNDPDCRTLAERVRKLESLVRLQHRELKGLENDLAGKSVRTKKTSARELRQQEIDDNKDAITEELNNLALRAYKFFLTPLTKGGGGHSYTGFIIPSLLSYSDYASYSIGFVNQNQIQIRGTSLINRNWIATISGDENGFMGISYNGFNIY